MKLWKIIPVMLAVLLFAGCGTAQTDGKTTGKPMTIYPTEFSAETKKVLDILDDEAVWHPLYGYSNADIRHCIFCNRARDST